ncbi:MAG TPA: tetratricopeptide repeat protein [Chthoniobacterales bacterium]|jgi:tetratricopeptide (TPR) repeat protein|nr:tetratricopeptide repeat protein [Chthoniobacterales bacterium]
MRLRPWQIFTCSICLASTLQSQEVRRALPVTPTPVPAPRAQPVFPDQVGQPSILDENIPSSQSAQPRRPVDNTKDVKTSTGSPAEPDSKTRDEADQDEIRLAPGQGLDAQNADPAKAQLAIADGLYIRKLYDLAVPEYEKYLGQFLTDSGRPSAMYRLADCYANLGQEEPALNTYRMLVDEVRAGEFVGSAAFRLGSRAFDKKNFQEAAPLYEKAYANAKSPEIKLTARYYQAKCLELIGKKAEAAVAYGDVAKFTGKNPYRDAARLSLAYFALENNQKQQAFDLFSQLGTDAAKPAVKAEALTRAGILAADLKQKDNADQHFKAAIALNAEGKWKQIAELEQMKLQYEGDKFSQVLDSYAKSTNSLGDETRPSVMLLVANSYRQLGKQQKALELYNQLIHIYSNTPEAYDARYQRLVSLDAIKDPSLVTEVDSYLATGPSRDRADKAKLLKAQTLFQQRRFEAAGRLYLELTNSSLADQYKADCYYAAGFSFLQLNDNQSAIHAFTGLIDKFPKHRMTSKALLKRALLYQEAKNLPAALNDFSKIIADYPASAETETALLQKGLTLGQQAQYPQMTAAFRELLKNYPNSTGAAQANYWIGWAAFEGKHFEEAIAPLSKARDLNPDEFAEKTTLRLILCYQNLRKKTEAAKEVDGFIQKDPQRISMVLDVCRWLGSEFYNENNFEQAAKYFGLMTKNTEPAKVDKGIWLNYAKSLNDLKNYQDATGAIDHYLELATDPAERAQGFLVLSSAQLGAKDLDPATKSAEQALSLQPEGRLNAEARMSIGDIESARGNYENAARSYMSVALLYEDPEVTPRALEHAYGAFQKAGNEPQATKTLSELKSRFPNYTMKVSTAG